MPVYGAFACSAGELSAAGYARLRDELLAALEAAAADGVDAVYWALHGAMGAEGELDPEGDLLERARAMLGPDVPFVMSLDLHGILTAACCARRRGSPRCTPTRMSTSPTLAPGRRGCCCGCCAMAPGR